MSYFACAALMSSQAAELMVMTSADTCPHIAWQCSFDCNTCSVFGSAQLVLSAGFALYPVFHADKSQLPGVEIIKYINTTTTAPDTFPLKQKDQH